MPTSSAGRWYEDDEAAPRADVASNTLVAVPATTFTTPFNTEDALAFAATLNVGAFTGTGSPTLVVTLQSANDQPNTGTYAVQQLQYSGTVTGGTFTLTYGGQTTAAIPYNATGAQIQAALALLSSVGVGPQGQVNIQVTGAPFGLGQALVGQGAIANIMFQNNLVGPQSTVTVNNGAITGGGTVVASSLITGVAPGGTAAVQSLHASAAISAGTYTITYGGQVTAPLQWNATAAQVQTALAALSNLGVGAVTVTGGTFSTPTDYTCTFTRANPFQGPALPFTIQPTGITGGTLSVVQTTAGVAAIETDWFDVKAFPDTFTAPTGGQSRAVFGPLAAFCRWKVVTAVGSVISCTYDITGTTEKRRS
jgi:hypothetical protein